MKASYMSALFCECKMALSFTRSYENNIVLYSCQNPYCKYHGKVFLGPTVELELKDAPKPVAPAPDEVLPAQP